MKRNEVHVAVSGFGGLNNPHPGLATARALRAGWRGPIQIHALGYDPMMTGAWMPNAANRLHMLPSLLNGDDAVLECLLEIHHRYRLDAIIPCLDLEMPCLSRLASALRHAGVRVHVPSPHTLHATSKLRLSQFAFDNDIHVPKTIYVPDLRDLALHAEQFGFPLMVKGTVTGARKVRNADQARKEARHFHEMWGGGAILQETMIGDEFVVGAVVSRRSRCLGMVAVRKLGINSDGKAVFGAVIDDPGIEAEARRILGKLDWMGPLELEFIRPHGSNRLYLLEINCRFPSWIMLSQFADCNLPVMHLRETLEPARSRRVVRPRAGTMYVRDIEETVVPLDDVDRLERRRTEKGRAVGPAHRGGRSKNGLAVAVTGLACGDIVSPGLGVARALRRVKEVSKVYGLGYTPFDSGFYQADAIDAGFRLPASGGPGALLDRLAEIHRARPFDVILPCHDAEIPQFIRIEAELEEMGVRTLLPSETAFDRRRKANLFTGGLRRDWGAFEIPKTHRVRSESQLMKALDTLGYPVAIKGVVSESVTAETAWEARATWFDMRERGHDEALVQRLYAGSDFAVAAVCDRNHEARAMLTVKKSLKCGLGSTWGAINTVQPDLEASVWAMLKALNWCGPVEAEFIRDHRMERYYLIEINPRFTGWISFSAALGHNHPYHAVCLALGHPYEPQPEKSKFVFMRSCREVPVRTKDFAAVTSKGRLDHD